MDGTQNTQPVLKNACKLAATLKIRGGCERDRYGNKAGKGPLVQWEKSGTLGVSQDQTLFVWYGAYKGGRTSMGSQGSGINHDVCFTLNGLDTHAVAYCFGIDQQGGKGGANWLNETCPTILSDSHGTPHAVCYSIDHVVCGGGNCTAQGPCYYEDICPTLKAAGPHAVAVISDGKEITRSE